MVEAQQKKQAKKMLWITLAMMAFSTVQGFGNVVNGYVYFDGTKVIFSWVLMFLLYFIPYALMVGELGATFKDSEGGVSSWINETMGVKWAYYAGWTYWACHVVYISSKSTGGLRAMSWGIAGNVRQFTNSNYAICYFDYLPILLLGNQPWCTRFKDSSNNCWYFNLHYVNPFYFADVRSSCN